MKKEILQKKSLSFLETKHSRWTLFRKVEVTTALCSELNIPRDILSRVPYPKTISHILGEFFTPSDMEKIQEIDKKVKAFLADFDKLTRQKPRKAAYNKAKTSGEILAPSELFKMADHDRNLSEVKMAFKRGFRSFLENHAEPFVICICEKITSILYAHFTLKLREEIEHYDNRPLDPFYLKKSEVPFHPSPGLLALAQAIIYFHCLMPPLGFWFPSLVLSSALPVEKSSSVLEVGR